MKKIIFVLLIALNGSALFAQENKTSISAGFTLAPQAAFNPKSPSDGFKYLINLFPQVTIAKGKLYAVGFYSIAFNNFGAAIGVNPTPKFTSYVVGFKSTMTSNNYLGAGIGTPLASGRATGFIEFGSSMKNWTPSFYVGMFIPFTVNLR